jgi:hypothetical protein
MSAAGTVRTLLIGIRSEESVFRRPGFAPEAWPRFRPVAHSLVAGYHATLEDSSLPVLVPRLDAVAPELRGFAYEGAGMALAALDVVAPWKRRLQEFVDGPGAPHLYPIYVGVGLALARLKRRPERHLAGLDPVLGWVIVDGYGFHAGFFQTRRYLQGRAAPPRLSPYAMRVFDQGLGRALWFSGGAVVDRIAATVDGFPPVRQAELWSGIGLASAYGGGTDRAGLHALRAAAGPYRAQLARGAATAAGGRAHAGNPAEHTELACEVFCGLPARDAAAVMDRARENLPGDGAEPAYEVWRQRAHALFSAPRSTT